MELNPPLLSLNNGLGGQSQSSWNCVTQQSAGISFWGPRANVTYNLLPGFHFPPGPHLLIPYLSYKHTQTGRLHFVGHIKKE